MLERGLANTDARVARRQAGDADLPVRGLAVERGAARAQRARGGSGARFRPAHAGLRCRIEGAAVARRDSAALRGADARAVDAAAPIQPPQRDQVLEPAAASALSRGLRLSCCCGRRSAWRIRSSRIGGRTCRRCRRRSASRWCKRAPPSPSLAGGDRGARAPPPAPAARRGGAQLADECALAPGLHRSRQQSRTLRASKCWRRASASAACPRLVSKRARACTRLVRMGPQDQPDSSTPPPAW